MQLWIATAFTAVREVILTAKMTCHTGVGSISNVKPQLSQPRIFNRPTLLIGDLLPHLIPQLSLAMNIVFSPFVGSMDDYLYSSAQLVVSNVRVHLGCTAYINF